MADFSGSNFQVAQVTEIFSTAFGDRYLEQEKVDFLGGELVDDNGNVLVVTAFSLVANGNNGQSLNPQTPRDAALTGYGVSASETYTITITKN